jgi:predicted metal-dependent peptidase
VLATATTAATTAAEATGAAQREKRDVSKQQAGKGKMQCKPIFKILHQLLHSNGPVCSNEDQFGRPLW